MSRITVLSPSPALDVTYLLDELAIGGIHRPRSAMRLAGGKGMNVARAAAVLGQRVRVIAALGGPIGSLVAAMARTEGLSVEVVEVAEETRMCVSVIPGDGAPTEFYEPPPKLSRDEIARLAGQRLPGWTVLAGRLVEGLVMHRIVDERIAIDSSGAGLGQLLDGLRPDLLKINVHEARELLGFDGEPLRLADALRQRTGGTVVLTAGADGAVAIDASGAWLADADPIPGRFAIGSGDSFFAGLMVALDGGESLRDALHAASAAGSANTRVPGAAQFTLAEVAAARARIEVHSA